MNLLLHQVAKDIRYIRWPLALWLALLALATLPLAFKVDTLLADGAAAEGWLVSGNRILLFLLALSSWLIAARVVHADPSDSGSAFWLTRPLSPGALLAAKLLSITGLFVVLPAAALAAAALANGMSGTASLRLFSEAVLVALVFVLAIVLLAALTRDLARLVLAAIVVSIGWLGVRVRVELLASRPLSESLTWYSALLAGLILFSAGAVFLVREQYRTRRTARSVWFSLLLVLAVVALVELWPWNFLGPRAATDDRDFDSSRVSVALVDARLAWPAPKDSVGARFVAENVPAGWVVVPTAISSSLTAPGGQTRRYSEETWLASMGDERTSSVFGATGQALTAVRHVLGGRWLNDPWEAPVSPKAEDRGRAGVRITTLKLPGAAVLAAGVNGVAGDFQSTLHCSAYRARMVTAVRLEPGSRAKAAGVETTILGVRRPREPGRTQVELDTRMVRPRLVFPRFTPGIAYVLRNQQRGEMLIGLPIPRRHAPPALGGPCLDLLYEVIDFSAAINQPLSLDDDWLRGAELVLVALEERGRFVKTVHIPNFRVGLPDPVR